MTARGSVGAAEHGRVVPVHRLIEDPDADAAPPRAPAGVLSYVSHLRRALGPGRMTDVVADFPAATSFVLP